MEMKQNRVNIFSLYGSVEDEECFTVTRSDFEWERRGKSTFSSAA